MAFGMRPLTRKDERTQPLGTRKIDGLMAIGTERTWILPLGAIGNDRALVTTEDTWFSPKLKLVLLSVRNDPRFGQTIYSLKDLKLASPKEKIFRVPSGHKLQTLAPRPIPPADRIVPDAHYMQP